MLRYGCIFAAQYNFFRGTLPMQHGKAVLVAAHCDSFCSCQDVPQTYKESNLVSGRPRTPSPPPLSHPLDLVFLSCSFDSVSVPPIMHFWSKSSSKKKTHTSSPLPALPAGMSVPTLDLLSIHHARDPGKPQPLVAFSMMELRFA